MVEATGQGGASGIEDEEKLVVFQGYEIRYEDFANQLHSRVTSFVLRPAACCFSATSRVSMQSLPDGFDELGQ